MLVQYTWDVEFPTSGGVSGSSGSGASALSRSLGGQFDPYGSGIIRPFHRASADFATASGIPKVLSCVEQVLGTDLGSIPWRPRMGTRYSRLRHKNNTIVLKELARVDTENAITLWEPRAKLQALEVEQVSAPGSAPGEANALFANVTIRIGGKSKTLRAPM